MKKVRLFVNQNEKSAQTAKELTNLLKHHGFVITEEEFELAISIGGDGAFLRMVRKTNFDPNVYYIGVHTGTLGFLPEVLPTELKEFVLYLEKGNYEINEIGILQTIIEKNNEKKEFYSLNEIVIRDLQLNSLTLDIELEDEVLECFKGDGMLVSTSIGSTAYNLSFRGSIVYFKLHTLQLTPIAPFNSSSYRNLQNSIVIPEYVNIKMKPIETKNLMITVDGQNYEIKDVTNINIKIGDKKIKRLRYRNIPFSKIIKEKFLG